MADAPTCPICHGSLEWTTVTEQRLGVRVIGVCPAHSFHVTETIESLAARVFALERALDAMRDFRR